MATGHRSRSSEALSSAGTRECAAGCRATSPDNPQFLDTLGVARYRTGNYSGAIADLENSIKLGGFERGSTFFLAMARAQLGELDQAKKLFDDADRWMRDNHSDDGELSDFERKRPLCST